MDNIEEYLKSGKMFYRPFCNAEEIEHIYNVQDTEDYLLKIRADEIVNHVRLYRVMRRRIQKNSSSWNFTKHFSTKEFKNYLRDVPIDLRKNLKRITKGFVFSNEPNGNIIQTDFGKIIIISESLQYFLYYMNLFFLECFHQEVPERVRIAALRIAIRIMLKKEAMDFELDPRGIIPKEIDKQLKMYTRGQIEFIIGHEYAHYYLKHLDDNNIIEKSLFLTLKNDKENSDNTHIYKFYTHFQKEEFDADLNSLITPNYSRAKLSQKVDKAVLFFIYLSIYEEIEEYFYVPSVIKTHPPSEDRLRYILDKTASKILIDDKTLEQYFKKLNLAKKFINEDVSEHDDEIYGSYGSIYLDLWRGPVLRDRIDY